MLVRGGGATPRLLSTTGVAFVYAKSYELSPKKQHSYAFEARKTVKKIERKLKPAGSRKTEKKKKTR